MKRSLAQPSWLAPWCGVSRHSQTSSPSQASTSGSTWISCSINKLMVVTIFYCWLIDKGLKNISPHVAYNPGIMVIISTLISSGYCSGQLEGEGQIVSAFGKGWAVCKDHLGANWSLFLSFLGSPRIRFELIATCFCHQIFNTEDFPYTRFYHQYEFCGKNYVKCITLMNGDVFD